MRFLKKFSAEWPLRFGLGLMYIYSGISLIREPQNWLGFLPQWLPALVSRVLPVSTYLALQGAGELIIAFLLMGWFLPRPAMRVAAGLASLEILFIVLFVGVDLVTFRDLGLLGGALSLFLLSAKDGNESFKII